MWGKKTEKCMIRALRFFCDATYTKKKKSYATYAFFLYKKETYAKKKKFTRLTPKKKVTRLMPKKKIKKRLTLFSTIELRF